MIKFIRTFFWPLKINFLRYFIRRNNLWCVDDMIPFRNKYAGKRCFIIGTGPSLTIADLEVLSNEITFASNGIYKIFPETTWRPTFYSVCDKRYYENVGIENMKDIHKLEKFYPWDLTDNHQLPNSHFFFRLMKFGRRLPRFSTRADKFLYEGSTVTYFMLQLAAYMGFREIYLLGIDFSYSISVDNNGCIIEDEKAKDYFTKEEDASKNPVLPNLQASLYSYLAANKYANSHGFNIYNTTRGGKLEVFKRKIFEELF